MYCALLSFRVGAGNAGDHFHGRGGSGNRVALALRSLVFDQPFLSFCWHLSFTNDAKSGHALPRWDDRGDGFDTDFPIIG